MLRRSEAKHCSSLCLQSEGDEFCGDQERDENPTKSYPRALTMFATWPWPSLCEQSKLQCWRRNKRLCGSTQISAARVLPPTFYISEFCPLMFVSERGSRHERIWEQTRTRLGAETNASGSRDERVWEQRRTHTGWRSPKGIGAEAEAMFFRLSALFPVSGHQRQLAACTEKRRCKTRIGCATPLFIKEHIFNAL